MRWTFSSLTSTPSPPRCWPSNTLVNEVVNPQPILVVVECGIFKEAHDIPRGFEVHCLDYDVEHLPPERLEISPIDGEACTITKFTS